jgi:transcriptional regulator with XRE-family HTH domain
MDDVLRIHHGKTPVRIHFIAEWAALRGLKAVDIVNDLGADPATVSRWFNEGNVPSAKYLEPLAEYLGAPDANALFHDPQDDWIARLFQNVSENQKQKAIDVLTILFSASS